LLQVHLRRAGDDGDEIVEFDVAERQRRQRPGRDRSARRPGPARVGTVEDGPVLAELLRAAAPELLGRREAQELFEIFARREPKLVDEVVPNVLSLGDVLLVLRQLLRESVPIRDLRSILGQDYDAFC